MHVVTARPNWKYFPVDLKVNLAAVDVGFYDYRASGPLLACS